MDKVPADHRDSKVQDRVTDGKAIDQRDIELQWSEEKQVNHFECGNNEVVENREG